MTHPMHDRFLDTAAELSPELAEAMERVGPAPLPRRAATPFPEYLARAVAGQQLSVIAARSIWTRVEAAGQGAPLLEGFHGERAEALRACGLSNAKVKTLIAIADAVKARVWPWIKAGAVRPVIDSRFTLDEVVKAHERMDSMAHSGKILLTP